MSLLYPIGLLALAGLVIPVIIHLWNITKGKTIKIGSTALLTESASTSAKSLKLTQIFLFILRCLILGLIALLLAQPFIATTKLTKKNSGWILFKRDQFKEVYGTHKKTIDSLLNLDFELHDFNIGFSRFYLKDSLAKQEGGINISYSSLINQLNEEMPKGFSAYLFTDYKLTNFEGILPKPNFNLVWNEIKDLDTISAWSTQFIGQQYQAKSTPTKTSYTKIPTVNLPIVSALIYDPLGIDGNYIKAALKTISDYTGRKIEIKKWEISSTKADVGFWLTDKEIDANHLAALKQNASLLTYKNGKVLNINSSLVLNGNQPQIINLFKRVAGVSPRESSLWTDGFGNPILSKQDGLKDNKFYFYSRFNPQWTDLVWKEQFVQALMPLVLGNQSTIDFGFENHANDQRVLTKSQLASNKNTAQSATIIKLRREISQELWLVVFFLILIERIVSFSKKTKLIKAYV